MKKLVFAFSMILSIILLNIDVKAQSRPISSQAKGALIGGAGGALLGAVVGHNVKGALLGAAIGAGSGYIIGNEHRMNEEKRYASYNRGYNSGYYQAAYRPRAEYRPYRDSYRQVHYVHTVRRVYYR